MTTTSNANKRTTKTKKTARKTAAGRGKPPERQAVKREAPGQSGGMDLLRIADKVGLQQYAAEGFRDRKTRAMAVLARMMETEGDKADVPMDEIMLKAQYIRERGGMEPDEIFAGMDCFAEETAWEDRELNRLSAAIDAKYKEYGAKKDEHWADGEAPEDMEILRTAFDERFRQLKVAFFRHYSENEMADLLINDPGAYADRVAKGRPMIEDRKAKHEKAK